MLISLRNDNNNNNNKSCFVFCENQITARDPFTELGRKKKQHATLENWQPKALLETLSLFGKKIYLISRNTFRKKSLQYCSYL